VHILYLADIRFPLERANGIQTMETCAALARRGHHVVLHVRPDTARPVRDPWTFYGIERDARLTLEQPAWLGLRAPQPLRRLMYLLSATKRWRRVPRPDIIFTRDLGVAALLLRRARALDAPLVYESHGYAPEVSAALPSLLSDGAAPHERKIERLEARERLVWQRADGYVTITAVLARDLLARFGSRRWTATIPDGTRPPEGRAGLGPDTHGRAAVVGYAGHLYPWKGVEILIEALEELPATRGLVIGGHPGEADLARLRGLARAAGIEGRVEFTGFVPPAEVRTHLKRADVLVLPNPAHTISARYTSPLKLFEYMAAGRPIVASDLPALGEIIQDGRNGLLVEAGNPGALALAIRRLLDDRALAERLATCAFNEARLYTWENRAQRLEQLFGSVLTNRRGAGVPDARFPARWGGGARA
jgi:glycosyltransferase involved in cell wall biosynthesis